MRAISVDWLALVKMRPRGRVFEWRAAAIWELGSGGEKVWVFLSRLGNSQGCLCRCKRGSEVWLMVVKVRCGLSRYRVGDCACSGFFGASVTLVAGILIWACYRAFTLLPTLAAVFDCPICDRL